MEPMLKVRCTECDGKYYVLATGANLQLPEDIRPGEAFPNGCPLCNEGSYAILADVKK